MADPKGVDGVSDADQEALEKLESVITARPYKQFARLIARYDGTIHATWFCLKNGSWLKISVPRKFVTYTSRIKVIGWWPTYENGVEISTFPLTVEGCNLADALLADWMESVI